MNPDIAYMGQCLREYEPPRFNVHTIVNRLMISTSTDFTMEVEFPDVSFWQGDINFDVMSTKTDAIIIRAGQNKWVDTEFEENYAEAKGVGLLVGVYWFYDGRASPGEQAELLISILRGKKLELEVYIDWEHNYGGAHEGLRNVVAMMQVVEQAGLNIKGVGLYTGYYFFRANSNPIANLSQYNYLRTKPLWEAWYSDTPAHVLIPAPWTQMNIWQWGTPAWAWGQQSQEIDMNFFNGTKQEFAFLYGNTGEPEPMPDHTLLTPNTDVSRSIRASTTYPRPPHIMGAKIGQINAGSSARAVTFYQYTEDIIINGQVMARAGDKWWNVYEANGTAISGWVAEKHLGQVLLNTRFVPENPTQTLPDLPVSITLGDDVTYQKQTVNVVLKPK